MRKTIKIEGKEYKVFPLDFYGEKCQLIFSAEKYADGTLAVEVYDIEEGDLFTVATVNLRTELMDGYAFFDENNNPTLKKYLKKWGLVEDTGTRRSSGYCVYPLYKWNIEKF